MKRRDRKEEQKRIYIRKHLKFSSGSQKKAIGHAIDYGQIYIKGHLRSIEFLFAHDLKKRSERAKVFDIHIARNKYKEFRYVSGWLKYYRLKDLKKSLKNIDATRGRQYFRNAEVFRLMIKEINSYIKKIKKDSSIKKLAKIKGDIGKATKDYQTKRMTAIKKFREIILDLNKQMKKSIFLNNIESYINLYIDFFRMEEERMEAWKSYILDFLVEKEEERVIACIAKEDELNLDLPSWRFWIPGAE